MSKRAVKRILLPLLLSLCALGEALGACSGSSPTLTAASAAYTDVKACTDSATYGDTVNIPAGTQTWGNTIALTKDVKLIGAGKAATLLTNAYITFTPDATTKTRLGSGGAGMFEVSGIGFTTASTVITITNSNSAMIRRIKIHDCEFTNTATSSMVSAVAYTGDVSGVFYSNVLHQITPSYSSGSDDYSWRSNLMSLGAGAGWYIEDNTEDWTTGANGYTCMGGGQGMGYVCRYNTATGTAGGSLAYSDSHGCQVNITGTQITEEYGNKFTVAGSSGFGFRGSKAMVFFNIAAANSISLSRDYTDTECFAGSISVPAECTSGTNDDSTQSCNDLVDPGTDCVCQKMNHSYFFVNRVSATGSLTTPSNSATGTKGVELNREYFNYNASFDGTSGVGVGSSRPATCTVGVGYWETAQTVADLTNYTGASPATPLSGTLYRCTATDTWTAYYTPYAYPHPLRGGYTSALAFGAGSGSIAIGAGSGSITISP